MAERTEIAERLHRLYWESLELQKQYIRLRRNKEAYQECLRELEEYGQRFDELLSVIGLRRDIN